MYTHTQRHTRTRVRTHTCRLAVQRKIAARLRGRSGRTPGTHPIDPHGKMQPSRCVCVCVCVCVQVFSPRHITNGLRAIQSTLGGRVHNGKLLIPAPLCMPSTCARRARTLSMPLLVQMFDQKPMSCMWTQTPVCVCVCVCVCVYTVYTVHIHTTSACLCLGPAAIAPHPSPLSRC